MNDKNESLLLPSKNGWVILIDKYILYIGVVCDTKNEATNILEDLLKPYPKDSIWRKRLTVVNWPIKKKNNPIKVTMKELEELCKDPNEKILSQNKITPYGFRRYYKQNKIIENLEEQRIIKRVFRYAFIECISINGICKKMATDGTKNRIGKPFTKNQILKIIDRFKIEEKANKNENIKRTIRSIPDQYEGING